MKHVTFIVPECEVNLNCIGGAYEILSKANNYWQTLGNVARLEIHVAGFESRLKSQQNFLTAHPTDIRLIKNSDLLIIPPICEDYEHAIRNNRALINWIKEQYKKGAEVASICSGTFILAATGLLDGKTCSTHWHAVEKLRLMFPKVKIAEGKVITDERGIYTNGGGYSFLNLMLYLVEKIFDRTTAIFCSKFFQIDMERTTQSPFTIFQAQKGHGDEMISKAQVYLEENVGAKVSFEKLAAQLAVSRRNFNRRFVKATGNTPVEYLQRVKIEAAKKELESGRKTISEIMDDVGYTDNKAFREVFKKVTGLSPQEYRVKYNMDGVVSH